MCVCVCECVCVCVCVCVCERESWLLYLNYIHAFIYVSLFACVLMSVSHGPQLLFCDCGICLKQRNLLCDS